MRLPRDHAILDVARFGEHFLPLFAFVVMRVQGARTQEEQWVRSLEQHRRIIDALKTHDPVFAERLVTQTVGAFLEETRDVVESGR